MVVLRLTSEEYDTLERVVEEAANLNGSPEFARLVEALATAQEEE
jgi:hypothetical protein